MPAETDEIVDVCIVGAGMAGLVVAAETAAAGLRTVVVDASDRVGGMLAPVMIAGGAGVGAAGGQVAADAGAPLMEFALLFLHCRTASCGM